MASNDDRLTEIEIAISYDRELIEQLNQELYLAHQEIEALKKRAERLERSVEALLGEIEGAPPNEKPPHY
ncbi:MAG: SlyX family protein [Deltaproteobacteria bacterium]|nr:SlyX family protein [Deltaproteobacteria bacterium]